MHLVNKIKLAYKLLFRRKPVVIRFINRKSIILFFCRLLISSNLFNHSFCAVLVIFMAICTITGKKILIHAKIKLLLSFSLYLTWCQDFSSLAIFSYTLDFNKDLLFLLLLLQFKRISHYFLFYYNDGFD